MIENCQKNYKQTCSKQKIANVLSVNECHTSSRVRKTDHLRSRQNVPGRSKMASKPSIAWNTERFLLHVRYTNSTCSPSSNANIFWSMSFQFLTVYLFLIILFFSRNYCMHDPSCNADLLFVLK